VTLEHLIREPAGEPEGALVLSHGRGTSERDLFPLLDELDPERRLVGISPGAPITGIPPAASTGTWSSASATRTRRPSPTATRP
jgi:predicted esterase